jgi:hypothetical protein
MGLLSDVLLFPITGPARGLYFIFEQIKEQVDEELQNESIRIEDELMNLGMRYELGEISEQDYADQETALLERLNELRKEQEYWQTGEMEDEDMEDEADEAAVEERESTDES